MTRASALRRIGRDHGPRRPPISVNDVLAAADAWYAEKGQWPEARDTPDWRSIDEALRYGRRGLPGGLTLARLLAEHRGARHPLMLPRYSVRQIVAWARAHLRRTGKWPNARSGPVPEAPGENWRRIDTALRGGLRGLPRGPSLARLLADRLGVRTRAAVPRLAVEEIVAWAKAHRRRTGKWPSAEAGPIPEAPGETWKAVDVALAQGHRGLPGGESLHRLLRRLGHGANGRTAPGKKPAPR